MSKAAEQKRMYVAQCVNDPTLFWNNDSGWGAVQTAQVYDDLAESTLPFEGQWVALASVDQLCADVALSETSKCALLMCGQEGEQEVVAQFYRAHKELGLRAAALDANKAMWVLDENRPGTTCLHFGIEHMPRQRVYDQLTGILVPPWEVTEGLDIHRVSGLNGDHERWVVFVHEPDDEEMHVPEWFRCIYDNALDAGAICVIFEEHGPLYHHYQTYECEEKAHVGAGRRPRRA